MLSPQRDWQVPATPPPARHIVRAPGRPSRVRGSAARRGPAARYARARRPLTGSGYRQLVSTAYLTLVPADPGYVPSDAAIATAIELVRAWFENSERVTFEKSSTVEFHEMGGNWEGVFCPACGTEIELRAWQSMMDAAYDTSRGFGDVTISPPCCHTVTTLNDLRYESGGAGFARFALRIESPGRDGLTGDQKARLEQALGTEVRPIQEWR
jgi:hypothetical protein